MLSALLLIIFIVAVESTFPYPPFTGITHHSPNENIIDPLELANRRAIQSNEVVSCDLADILNSIRLEDLQEMIEVMAVRTGVSPFMVLRKLNRRMKNREEIEEAYVHSIDGPEFLNQPILDLPPSLKMPPESNRVPYSLPSNTVKDGDNEETRVVIVPVAPSSFNRVPIGLKPEHKPRKESTNANDVTPLDEKLNMLPGVFLSPLKNSHLRPPLGATVRVDAGDHLSPLSRDIAVTVSPLMTLIEALRQAEIKYQNILGLNHDTDVITFARSPLIDCYIVKSIDDVVKNEDSGWKVTITDRDGQIVYDSFCLPSGKDAVVKPGTIISLTYVPL